MKRFALLFLVGALTLAAQYFTFGAGGDRVTWLLCVGEPCGVETDVTNKFISTRATSLKRCYIAAKTAPQGADLIVDILRNGTSVFNASPKLVLPAGNAGPVSTASFNNPSLAENDIVTVNITQVGSTNQGKDVTAVCKF